jgi:hypothetical protein
MKKVTGIMAFALLLAVFWSMPTLAANKGAAILFVNLNNRAQGGESLAGTVLASAGYANVTEVNSPDDFATEWANRGNYDVIIISYHGISNSQELQDWTKSDGEALEAWVEEGNALLSTAGRDTQEADLAALFDLSFGPGGGIEAVVPLTPGTPFAEGIADNELNAINAPDPTPLNGELLLEPLPDWVEYVVTTESGGRPTMVAGSYGKGALALGTFEFTNDGTAADSVTQEEFVGFPTFWKNLMDWITENITAVSNAGKLTTTWGMIKSE